MGRVCDFVDMDVESFLIGGQRSRELGPRLNVR